MWRRPETVACVPHCDSIFRSAVLRQISPPLYGFPGSNQCRLLFFFLATGSAGCFAIQPFLIRFFFFLSFCLLCLLVKGHFYGTWYPLHANLSSQSRASSIVASELLQPHWRPTMVSAVPRDCPLLCLRSEPWELKVFAFFFVSFFEG